MSGYWKQTTYYSQISVEELQKKAKKSVESAQKKGRAFSPVIIEGREIAQSWWGRAWCRQIEQYADYASRINRGKRYVRSGAVVDLKIAQGKVVARVQGTRRAPYKVEVRISPLKEEICQKIIDRCTSQIHTMQDLVNGTFPKEMEDLFLSEQGLFPTQREISFICSCPDWAIMCKHVAAVLYAIGARLDENPFLFFEMRGVDVNRFVSLAIEDHVEQLLKHADLPKTDRVMDDSCIDHLFGLEI